MTRRNALVGLMVGVMAFGGLTLADEAAPNILVRFSVDRESGESVRSYEVVLANGSDTQFDAMTRYPMPKRSWKTVEESGEKVPVVSYGFHNAGFSASLTAKREDGGRIRLVGQVEDSRPIRPEPSTEESPPAKVDTFRQHFDALLDDGVPVQVLRYTDPLAGAVVLTVEARASRGGLES